MDCLENYHQSSTANLASSVRVEHNPQSSEKRKAIWICTRSTSCPTASSRDDATEEDDPESLPESCTPRPLPPAPPARPFPAPQVLNEEVTPRSDDSRLSWHLTKCSSLYGRNSEDFLISLCKGCKSGRHLFTCSGEKVLLGADKVSTGKKI